MISRSQAEELAFKNIKTVEQLAGVSDTLLQQFHGGGMLRQKAASFLERMKEEVTVDRLQDELASRDVMLAQMQKQIDELRAAYEED